MKTRFFGVESVIFTSIFLVFSLFDGYSLFASEAFAKQRASAPPVFSGYAKETSMNTRSENLRELGVKAYLLGFLGGRMEHLLAHVPVMGGHGGADALLELAWLYGVAYPASRRAWSGAVLEEATVYGNRLVVRASVPKIGKGGGGAAQSEWLSYEGNPDGSVHEERELRMNAVGVMPVSAVAFGEMKGKIVSDAKKTLSWCLENPGAARKSASLKRHVERVWSEHSLSSTVKLPPDLASEWKKVHELVSR